VGCASDRGQLNEDVTTVTFIFKHTTHPPRLAFKSLQTFDQLFTSG
jgi:hypothetical protein